ncbi:MAG: glycoside hydrolase family 99-like domain-containing protein [Acidimicrobiales bacterium]
MSGVADGSIRSIAFYLPQFHPIAENDEWWGGGFTEWTNVRPARPLFRGHYQPHVPGELGYYDLRDPDARQAQADLAGRYGIDAFCYYHYWFAGRRLLQQPFEEVLASGRPDLPFCLCWANEPWTRTWDGSSANILVDQHHSEEDDRRHIDSLIEAFRDARYVRIAGKPLFLVYRAGSLPDSLATTRLWRERAERAGLPGLFLCRVESHFESGDPRPLGFDASVEFQPAFGQVKWTLAQRFPLRRLLARMELAPASSSYVTLDYDRLVREMLQREPSDFPRFPCVTPQWDNTPRRPYGAFMLTGSTPERFGEWVAEVARRLRTAPPEHRLLFVNAWNEWGEGCHLEPCERWGVGYLEAFAKALVE